MAATEIIDIAPRGDVTLLCGEQVGDKKIIGLRVSSHILSYGSPVFNSLLAPKFREGTTLARTSSVEIPLPEDDPSHMIVLCNILHMRHDQEPYSINSPATLAEFAVLCDKYNCAQAVKPTLEQYITASLHTAEVDTLGQYLTVADSLRYDKLACMVGERLVLQLAQPVNEVIGVGSLRLGAMSANIANLVLQAHALIATFFESEIAQQLPYNRGCSPGCPVEMQRLTSLLKQLREYEVWAAGYQRASVDSTLRIMEGMQLYESSDIKACGSGGGCMKSRRYGIDTRSSSVHAKAAEIRAWLGRMDLSVLSTAS
ncbi:hypothetical protein LTR56_013687 [Elasticomyces elasticus]|nr:hypothetical protein LTR56_013687 [Elasticomyces elasticus]KAK3668489.1 hypothetical protein LTR22_000783 [Elasticomyces elasticus]KAK4930821.1 hypothetical protein LTR49_002585 [Elasticomyces elasticus]KAK5748231.1 hypothetical protein LTS12_021694 [Elasticomyces elasticus]